MHRPIPEKIRGIIPLLDSPLDGEALSATRAGGRVLAAAGLSYVDLAAAIPVGTTMSIPPAARPSPRYRATPAAPDCEFSVYRQRRAFTPMMEARHRSMAAYCADRPWHLSARERQFITGIERLRGNLTIPQSDWLHAIADRLSNPGRCA